MLLLKGGWKNMVNKHIYTGKTYEETVDKAKIDLQELEENLIINIK